MTTRRGDPAAGKGIYKALEAIKAVGGFVCLRSDKFWLYRELGGGTGDEFGTVEATR